MRIYGIIGLLLCFVSTSETFDAGASLKQANAKFFQALSALCNSVASIPTIFVPIFKPPTCDIKGLLDPLYDLFGQITADACPGCKYVKQLAVFARRFAANFNLLDIIAVGDKDGAIKTKLTKDLPDWVKEAYAGTNISDEMYNSFVEFNKDVTTEMLVDLVIGGNTDALFAIFLQAVSKAFQGNPEFPAVQAMFEKVRESYNNGRSAKWIKFTEIIKRVLGLAPF